jgi:uncharacterized protein with LGFP repeats
MEKDKPVHPCSLISKPSGQMTTHILEKHDALGGSNGFLGKAKGPDVATPDGTGCFQHFVGGSIYWTPQTGAWEVHGAIRDKWAGLGWEKSFLGYPTSDETTAPDGVGHYNHFQNGSIYWTPQTGAWEVHGAIRDKWAGLGWEKSALGYPTSDETTAPDGVGRYNHFQNGSIYWTPQTGAWEVHGAIRDKWASLGWEKSVLGYPTSDETTAPDGVGHYNHFQNGSIYWTPQTGAWEVHGAIRDKWASLGWEKSVLGYPTSDETTAPDGVGRYNHFQKGPSKGSIYWTPQTGAWEVHGAIRDKWASLGWEKSVLGYPRTDETKTPDATWRYGNWRYNHFQRGTIYWPPPSALDLVWDSVDENGIPLNPKWGWQSERNYGAQDYYPDAFALTKGDFGGYTHQELSMDYGGRHFFCGPHINWSIPVTYEGFLRFDEHSIDDDYNFFFFTPEGAGATIRPQLGAILAEFDSDETIDHFHAPWWDFFHKIVDLSFLVKPNAHDLVAGNWAIITALWGLDCEHGCYSELHPVWAMALNVKYDVNEDVWAMFVRNWGNEGWCGTDQHFVKDLPLAGNGLRRYVFRLPWRSGATSVSVLPIPGQPDALFWTNTKPDESDMFVEADPGKSVRVTFLLPHHSKWPRINTEIHLKWDGPAGDFMLPPGAVSASQNLTKATR